MRGIICKNKEQMQYLNYNKEAVPDKFGTKKYISNLSSRKKNTVSR